MSTIIYQIVLAALHGEDTGMLEYELGEKIRNHEVASAIVASIHRAIAEFNAPNMSALDDYEG